MKDFSPAVVNYTANMNTAESFGLISRCLAGDEQAIESFVRQHETGVFRLAYSILGEPHEAAEVTQETFIAAIKALPTYQDQSSVRAWLYKIALNTSRSRLRKQKVLEKLKNSLASIVRTDWRKQASPEEQTIQNEQERIIWMCLNDLDEKHRIVITLRYFQELATKEIADVLGISEGTVHSRLYTARERLRAALTGLQRD